jgi:hypothetical protein
MSQKDLVMSLYGAIANNQAVAPPRRHTLLTLNPFVEILKKNSIFSGLSK